VPVYTPPQTAGVGRIPYNNEAVIGNWFEKKDITIDYNFPGYRSYGLVAQTTDLGKIRKNTLLSAMSGGSSRVYRPVLLIPIVSSTDTIITVSTGDIKKLVTLNDDLTYTPIAAELARIWDTSAGAYLSGANDQARYISSVNLSTGAVTLNGALTSTPAADDFLQIGNGLEDVRELVMVDEEIDLSVTAKPLAVDKNPVTSALYRGRFNTRYVTNWTDYPQTFKDYVILNVQRIYFDFV